MAVERGLGGCGLDVGRRGDQLFAQLTLGEGVDRLVEGLVRDLQGGLFGLHGAQGPRDLLRRPQPAQHARDQGAQRPIGIQLAGRSVRLVPQLPAPGARTALQHCRDWLQLMRLAAWQGVHFGLETTS